jgi:hypothetical protein
MNAAQSLQRAASADIDVASAIEKSLRLAHYGKQLLNH